MAKEAEIEKLHSKFSQLTGTHKQVIMGAVEALKRAQERDGKEKAVSGPYPLRVLERV
jgi:hypothetical protein